MGWIQDLLARPAVAHWLRAIDRFLVRMGFALAAGLTFYMALAIVPVLMVTFGGLGFVVSTWFPELIDETRTAIAELFATQPAFGQQVIDVVQDAFDSWRTVFLIGLPASLVFGTWWVTRTRMAVRVMVRRDYQLPRGRRARLKRIGRNLAILILVETLLVLAVLLTLVATAAQGLVRDLLNLADTPATAWLLSAAPLAGTLLLGFCLFCLIFLVFPTPRMATRDIVSAGALGGIALTVLQVAAGTLIAAFGRNLAANLFGSVIVLMLYFNILGIILLVVAAWVGTIDRPDATSRSVQFARALVRDSPERWAARALAGRLDARGAEVRVVDAVRARRVAAGGGALTAVAAWAIVAGATAAAVRLVERRRGRR